MTSRTRSLVLEMVISTLRVLPGSVFPRKRGFQPSFLRYVVATLRQRFSAVRPWDQRRELTNFLRQEMADENDAERASFVFVDDGDADGNGILRRGGRKGRPG